MSQRQWGTGPKGEMALLDDGKMVGNVFYAPYDQYWYGAARGRPIPGGFSSERSAKRAVELHVGMGEARERRPL